MKIKNAAIFLMIASICNIIVELTNPKQTRSEWMQKNWQWVLGSIALIGNAIAWGYSIYKG
jgi:hypothetical protein